MANEENKEGGLNVRQRYLRDWKGKMVATSSARSTKDDGKVASRAVEIKEKQRKQKEIDRRPFMNSSYFDLPGWDLQKTRTSSLAIARARNKWTSLPLPHKAPVQTEAEVDKNEKQEEAAITIPMKRKGKSISFLNVKRLARLPKDPSVKTVLSSLAKETTTRGAPCTSVVRYASDHEGDQAFIGQLPVIAPDPKMVGTGHYSPHVPQTAPEVPLISVRRRKPSPEILSAEFDDFVNALERIFPHEFTIADFSFEDIDSSIPSGDFTKACERISSLFSLDFHVLDDSEKFMELVADLLTKLQNYPNLSADQVAMVKLIKELLSVNKDILEMKSLSDKADRFAIDIEETALQAILLKEKYNNYKKTVRKLQVEVDGDNSAIREIDNQIRKLEALHSELNSSVVKKKKALMTALVSSQKEILGALANMFRNIQLANKMEKLEWEVKKKAIADRQRAKINSG